MKIMFMIWLVVFYAIVLTGCASTIEIVEEPIDMSPVRSTDNFMTMVTQVTLNFTDQATMNNLFGDKLPEGANTRAIAFFNGNVCHVVLLHNDYPGCFLHEVLHCFEGDWHKDAGDEGNQQYCD